MSSPLTLGSRCTSVFLLLLALVACHDAPRSNPLDPATTQPVELEVTRLDARAINTLTWTPYAGSASFAAYWVLRSNARILPQVDTLDVQSDYYWVLANTVPKVDTLAVLSDRTRTAFTDTLVGGEVIRDWEYRISVVNSGGLEVTSEERGLAEK